MTGGDWDNCQGEVFTIWRLVGQILGDILVGDKVSLDPTVYTWLSCEGSCHTEPQACMYIGYVFKFTAVWTIYAKGKAVGETITSGDDIALRFDNQEWLSGIWGCFFDELFGIYPVPSRRCL